METGKVVTIEDINKQVIKVGFINLFIAIVVVFIAIYVYSYSSQIDKIK